MQYTGLIFSLQFDIENPDEPFLVSIGRDGTPEGLPVEGLTGVSEITITFDVADDYTTVKVSDLFVRACNEGDYMHVFTIIWISYLYTRYTNKTAHLNSLDIIF